MSSVKENANPQLFAVENAGLYSHSQRTPLDWTNLGSFVQDQTQPGTTAILPNCAEDKAILRAIMDSSRATTNGKGVGLLRKAGLVIPTYSSSVAGMAKASASSCYSDTSRPVFRLVEDGETKVSDRDNTISDESKISAEEIFDIIRTIQDPEHPNSLEQLGVVSLEQVQLSLASEQTNSHRTLDEIKVRFTPTIPHCSMATLIGLCLRVKLHRSLPPAKFNVDVSIEPGTHVSEKAINKQLRDKERVRAALENKHLAGVVDKCIRNGMMAS